MNKVVLVFSLFFCSSVFGCIESIAIFNSNFEKISDITDTEKISAINQEWSKKKVSEDNIRIDWSSGYKLDIAGDKCGGRWLYKGGWTMPLVKFESGFYKIDDVNAFESLLGIKANKGQNY